MKSIKRQLSIKKSRISFLKMRLSKTDYLAIKYAEGKLTAEEYIPMMEQRDAWRQEINNLQAEIKDLISQVEE